MSDKKDTQDTAEYLQRVQDSVTKALTMAVFNNLMEKVKKLTLIFSGNPHLQINMLIAAMDSLANVTANFAVNMFALTTDEDERNQFKKELIFELARVTNAHIHRMNSNISIICGDIKSAGDVELVSADEISTFHEDGNGNGNGNGGLKH